jgi:hypothetical protein
VKGVTAHLLLEGRATAVNEGQDWQQFGYSGKVPGTGGRPPEGCDMLNGFAVKLRAGRVALLQTYQVTSC